MTDNGKKNIHTTISNEKYNLLQEYSDLTDENDEKIFGTMSKVIEYGLELVDKKFHPEKNKLQEIWNRARDELNMVLVGKTTYLSYISGDPLLAHEKNIATEIIEWYKQKKIDELSVKETIEAIKDIWLAANYFFRIEINVGNKGSYQMTFHHDLHHKQYSEFWGTYFMSFLRFKKKCEVEIFARNESLILNITPP
ncbi:MAG: hypothetical protein GF329_11070 [Candidatus Lokiarchaeota archaeon]|nr:hypothetical protein [Candidatus Lokiarchaeota archaeon]